MLFKIMLSDFPPSTSDVKTLLYADTITICTKTYQHEDIEGTLQPFQDQVQR